MCLGVSGLSEFDTASPPLLHHLLLVFLLLLLLVRVLLLLPRNLLLVFLDTLQLVQGDCTDTPHIIILPTHK